MPRLGVREGLGKSERRAASKARAEGRRGIRKPGSQAGSGPAGSPRPSE